MGAQNKMEKVETERRRLRTKNGRVTKTFNNNIELRLRTTQDRNRELHTTSHCEFRKLCLFLHCQK